MPPAAIETADRIAPSILSADFARLGDEIRAVERAGADLIHFDVMDGHFVPNLSIGIPVLESVRKVTKLPLDAHLMISEPARYVGAFAKSGANSISVHVEVTPDVPAMAKLIRSFRVRASIGINPETDADRVLPFAEHLDMILVMSVHPGFGGQEFIPSALDKLRLIRRELKRRGLERVDVEIDGGVKLDNIADVKAAGANVFVSGSGIFGQGDYAKIVREMRARIAGGAAATPAAARGRAARRR
jgi:ribulose-phosphate 3-epimerase